MEEKKEAIIAKIMKLMELGNAEQNSNPHERNAAMKMAAKLMADYSIDFIDLKNNKPKGEAFVTMEVDGSVDVRVDYEGALAQAIVRAFDCKMIHSNHNHYWQMIFVGSKHDIEIAVYFFKFLRRTLYAMANKNVTKESLTPCLLGKITAAYLREAKRNYCFGMVETINDRLQELYIKREEFIPSNCKALVIVRKDDLEKFYQEKFPNSHKLRGRALRGDMNAYHKGGEDGHSVNLSRPISSTEKPTTQLGGVKERRKD